MECIENPLFASFPCVTNPLFDSHDVFEEGPLLIQHCSYASNLNLETTKTLFGQQHNKTRSHPSDSAQSMECIENPLFASFPCVTNPLFDSQYVFEEGIVDDVVGALEALKLDDHDEERTPYVIAKAMGLKESEKAHITAKEIGLNEVENINNSKLQLHNLVAQLESVSLLNKEMDSVSNIRKKLRHTALNNFSTHHVKEHLKSSAVATVSGDGKGVGYERVQLDAFLKESDYCSSQHNKLNLLPAGEDKHDLINVNNCSQLHLIKHSHVSSFDESLGAVGYAVQVKDALVSENFNSTIISL